MATEPLRLPYERRARELIRLYRQAQRTIVAQVRAALEAGNLARAQERRLQLAAVLAVLDQLGAATDPLARDVARQAFENGSALTAKQIAPQIGVAVSDVVVPRSFTGVSRDAVATLEDSILGRLRTARQVVGRQVDDMFARAGRDAAMRSLLGADGSAQTAATRMARDLRRRGVTGFVDKAGRNWQLENYSEMVVRTVTREAVVQGQLTRMASHGVNLARVSSHSSACKLCVPWEGRLVSLDGSVTEYQGESVADMGSVPTPPIHPNCRHTLEPVVTAVEDLRQEMGVAVA